VPLLPAPVLLLPLLLPLLLLPLAVAEALPLAPPLLAMRLLLVVACHCPEVPCLSFWFLGTQFSIIPLSLMFHTHRFHR
jgi:hypothetical protein